jgi:uncharacterized protein YkwD
MVSSLICCVFPAVAGAEDLNGFRLANGRSALQSDSHLAAMAAAHAADMARRNSLDHAGFFQSRGPAGADAENVAYGCGDTACTIRQWSHSAGHRTNMLRAGVTRYGLASAVSASGRRYWALELGGSAPSRKAVLMRAAPTRMIARRQQWNSAACDGGRCRE